MSVYEHTAIKPDGTEVPLSDYEGKVLLIVNTATGCGFTPQYEDLEAIYKKYRDQGLEILDFPCNQFKNQAPGTDDEIREFCSVKFGADFPQFKKGDVNGENAWPLFADLATQKPFDSFGKGAKAMAMKVVKYGIDKEYGDKAYIKWNITKFLVDREGNVVARFEPTIDIAGLEQAVANLL
ncbi:MAG: glutathione peroxidase [Coriobacteriaceae bacterium]|nr:glutathione peroxidase [Coriobacteriaceae bacterium]